MSVLGELQQWYSAQTDGDWEHSYGISIETLDNPGWCVCIDLHNTLLRDKHFEAVTIDDSDESWLRCHVNSEKFSGFGDASRLEEILQRFLSWAKSEPDWLAVLTDEEVGTRSDLAF